MSTKQYYRDRIATIQKRIVDLKSKLSDTKEDKKRKSEQLSKLIKNAKGSSKDMYRKQKISSASTYDNRIESIRKSIEKEKNEIKRYRASMKSAK